MDTNIGAIFIKFGLAPTTCMIVFFIIADLVRIGKNKGCGFNIVY